MNPYLKAVRIFAIWAIGFTVGGITKGGTVEGELKELIHKGIESYQKSGILAPGVPGGEAEQRELTRFIDD